MEIFLDKSWNLIPEFGWKSSRIKKYLSISPILSDTIEECEESYALTTDGEQPVSDHDKATRASRKKKKFSDSESK